MVIEYISFIVAYGDYPFWCILLSIVFRTSICDISLRVHLSAFSFSIGPTDLSVGLTLQVSLHGTLECLHSLHLSAALC